MINFVALDLETATADKSSICQIGITEVIDGVPQNPRSWLVQPEGNEYDSMNIWIHGITPEDTKDSPSFPEVWKEVVPYLEGKVVVAHNTSFDRGGSNQNTRAKIIKKRQNEALCAHFMRFAMRFLSPGCYSWSFLGG